MTKGLGYHVLSAERNQRRRDSQRQQGDPDMQLRLLRLIFRVLQLHLLGILASHSGRHLADLRDAATGIALGDFLAALFYLWTGTVVDFGMRFQLEEEIASVYNEENDASACGCERDSYLGAFNGRLPLDISTTPVVPASIVSGAT